MSTDLETIKHLEKQSGKVIMRLHHEDEEEFFRFTGFVTDSNDNVIHLNLKSFNISDISPIVNLKHLAYLNLEANKVSDISAVKSLKNLTYLNLGFNHLSDISALKNLTHLTYLNLENNRIADISPVKSLKGLIYLNVAFNYVADLSAVKGLKELNYLNGDSNLLTDIYDIAGLKELQELHLSDNKIQDILVLNDLDGLTHLCLNENSISDIYIIKWVVTLQHLELCDNRISDISPLKELPLLTFLSMNRNHISDISALSGLKTLTELELAGNRVSDISPIKGSKKVTRCDFADNKITHLPVEIVDSGVEITWKYVFSKSIVLNGNPLESPPVEIVRQGADAVRNYFDDLNKDESVSYMESKLLLVGNGKVGKTTLKRKLRDHNYQVMVGQEPETRGIRIEPWDLTCTLESGDSKKVKVHFWDFGGQDIYHATHQFFLTKRSLYIFVWEARKEEETVSFGYWLNIIKQLSDNSPVIVVMNKADIYRKYIDEAPYFEKFDNIVNFHQVSCVNGKGIEELVEEIKTTLGKMPHLSDKLPKAWHGVRTRLQQEKRNYISLNEYLLICNKFGLDKEKAEYLSAYLHDRGFILHYRYDRALENVVFINPEWATEAFYTLIGTYIIRESGGRFTFEILRTVWDPAVYPVEEHYKLVRLMEKFELCFNITGTHTFIIPELLPSQRPPIDTQSYRSSENLHFEYFYGFMPEGIISRFTSRNYYLIRDTNYWKTGVELTFEDSTALVTCNQLDLRLSISISGPQKAELLAIIRREMEYIHRTLNLRLNQNYYEMIPCRCRSCNTSPKPHIYKYELLTNFLKRDNPLFCPVSYDRVFIKDLFEGYDMEKHPEELVKTIVAALSNLLGVARKIKPDEDSWNSFIARILSIKGLIVKDRTQWGHFTSGKFRGRTEIKSMAPGGTFAVCEEFLLQSFDAKIINEHLHKLFNFEPAGIKENIVIIYSEAEDFDSFWNQYITHLPNNIFKYHLEGKVQEGAINSRGIKLARTRHRKGQNLRNVFHLLVDIRI
ncbi:MAG: GTP-binding protein [bacterium]|nr:GTP-binding protein [bacterium]